VTVKDRGVARPVHTERTYVEEGDQLEVPAKRRGSPRPATPNVPPLSASLPPPHFPVSTQAGIADIPVCTGRNYRNRFSVCVFITAGPSTKLFTWGGGIWEDMCYERRRAEACVD
jgi:hypothetical protein